MAKKIAKLDKPFVNRITGHGEERVDQMLANPLNFRLHPDNQQQALAGSIDDIGFIRSVTVNKRTGRVVDGHLRVTLAARSEVESLPVEYVDLTEAEEAQALLSLDPIAALAASDKAKLDELMRAVQSDDERVQQMMADMAEREGLEYGRDPQGEDPGAQVDKAEELREKWGVEFGQMWRLGEHRLICGDCTDRAVVERVMGGEKASLIVTDPPYGVDYDGGANNEKKREKLDGDKDAELYAKFLAVASIGDKCALYMWHAGRRANEVYQAAIGAGFEIRTQIIWHKLKAHYGAWMAQYKQKHEPCIYCVKNGPEFIGATNEVTVWEYDQPSTNEFHPTQKPIELMERAIRNHPYKIVYEPFSGSGTTLIACERLSRKCRAIEISPAYVAVALQRWADMTGKTPELISQ